MESSSGDPRHELIYQESIRALTEQQSVLDNLRTRTGIVLTGASLASTFLGAQALGDGNDLSCWSYAALASLAVLGVCCVGVLWPRRGGWKFSHNVENLRSEYITGPNATDIDEMHIQVARAHQSYWDANADRMKTMFWGFQLACLALVAEVAFWLIDIATRG